MIKQMKKCELDSDTYLLPISSGGSGKKEA